MHDLSAIALQTDKQRNRSRPVPAFRHPATQSRYPASGDRGDQKARPPFRNQILTLELPAAALAVAEEKKSFFF